MPFYQQSYRRRPDRCEGFTLVELLCSLAIAGIAISMALPDLSAARLRAQSKADVHSLTALLRRSRTAAVSSLHTTIICGTDNGLACSEEQDWSAGLMAFVDINENARLDEGDMLLQRLSPEYRLRAAKPRLRYNSFGGGDMSRLDYCRTQAGAYRTVQIFVSIGGRTRTSEPQTGRGSCP